MQDLLEDREFQRLEKLFPFLSRAREHIVQLEKEKYVIVDIETTGLDPSIKEIKDIFNHLINPKSQISPQIEQLTGINQEMVAEHPKIEEIAPKFLSFIEDDMLVAHNTDFDIPFLKHHSKKKFSNILICTLKLSRKYLINLSNHKLHTVASYFGIKGLNQHRALGDVETTYQLWMKMIPFLRDKGIYTKEDLQKALT